MIKKLGSFRPSEIITAINSLIDQVNRLQPRHSAGTKTSIGSKGTRRTASTGTTQRFQTTQQTIPVARYQ